MSVNPRDILKQYWGYDAFRPLQEDIVTSILQGHDTLALLPTGGGKSICFQVPAMAMEGVCLVISPLIALMKDQVENLKKRSIPALSLFTGMPHREIVQTLREAASGNCKFLYCSPERLQSSLFQEYLPGIPVSFIAVDEAHCISQWGYDFRPSYLNIAELRKQKPGLPFLALTASATPEVQEDIMQQLHFRNGKRFAGSFARANLSYHVMESESRIHTLVRLVKRSEGSAIVYCKSRKRTQEIADLLRMEKISATHYHAGLKQEVRNERQEAWIKGRIRVMVCTNAFGMGIDKPDVRLVVHLDCPDSLENYYQEAGRAGRDGLLSHTILLTDAFTVKDLRALPESRFPSMAVIRKVYQALGDYVQLPSGLGEDRYFDFDLTIFTKRFSLNVFEVMYALQALEQEGIISTTEQLFIPSMVMFTVNREMIEFTEQQHPQYEPLIKTLLRTYGGIWDQPSGISEKQVARILRCGDEEVKTGLRFLHSRGILSYEPRKETPQIRFLQNRVRADDLYIDQEKYQARKERYRKRVEAMASYITAADSCRTATICRYFGETFGSSCGICDHCMREKKRAGTEDLLGVLVEQLKKTPLSRFEMGELVPGKEEQVDKAIEFLYAEKKIKLNEEGRIEWIGYNTSH